MDKISNICYKLCVCKNTSMLSKRTKCSHFRNWEVKWDEHRFERSTDQGYRHSNQRPCQIDQKNQRNGLLITSVICIQFVTYFELAKVFSSITYTILSKATIILYSITINEQPKSRGQLLWFCSFVSIAYRLVLLLINLVVPKLIYYTMKEIS